MIYRYVEANTGPDAPTHAAVIFDHSGKSSATISMISTKPTARPRPKTSCRNFR